MSETMNNSDPMHHPIFSVAKTAIDQMGGACLAEDSAEAAAAVLLIHWADAIRNWDDDGPSGPEVERMITGDIRDVIDQMEQLLRRIEQRDE